MKQINRIYGGVGAETRKSQVSFQIISLMRGLPLIIFLTHYIYKTERPVNVKTFLQAITIYFQLVLTC